MRIGRSHVREASLRIAPFVRRTPIVVLRGDRLGLPRDVVLKLEGLQHSGSFKARGAFNTLLFAKVPASGVVAASGGNHGAAVAYAAARLGLPARVFVPAAAPEAKLARIRHYGADVVAVGSNYAEAYQASVEESARTGGLQIHAYDQAEVVAGQGTTAVELSEQAPELDTVLVAVGGGGLVAGCAAWYTDSLRVVGVEPEQAPTLHAARAAGTPVDVEVSGIAADSLGARRLGSLAHEVTGSYLHSAVLVPDSAIRKAQRLLWDELRLLVEPGGATAVAALLCGSYVPGPDDRVGAIVCGANVDPASWSVLPDSDT